MASARRFGLIGYPLAHSFSQKFFSDKFSREGIEAEYDLWELPSLNSAADLPDADGFNVTIPHKQTVISLLDDMDEEARMIGAVNVVKVVRDADGTIRRKGFNTDAEGFRRSLLSMVRFDPKEHEMGLVLGTGGASKAVAHALRQIDIEPVFVSREKGKGDLTYEELTEDVMKNHRLIVNCTPLGTYPNVESFPPIPYEWLSAHHFCYDLVYNPSDTTFLKLCREKGATVKNGEEMLRNQALLAWEIWNS